MKITFKGNIGKDAVLRTVTNGDRQDSVCDIWVAENIRSRNSDTQKTLWHKVTIWRKYAETMAQYLKTGRKIEVSGNAEAKYYTTKDGRIMPYVAVQNAEIEFLDRPVTEQPPEVAEEPEVEEGYPWD